MRKLILNEQQIIEDYNNNLTQKAIAEKNGVSRAAIKRVLIENKVPLRERTVKYPCNNDIFEKIDSVEKAYWLGFLAADGCNYQREQNAMIVLSLHKKDREHIQKFKDFCKSEAQIIDFIQTTGFSNNTEMSKITINSLKMSKDLADKGVVPRKSMILKPPKIEEKYYFPFILGYFDGDGSIFENKTMNPITFGINIEGTAEVLNWINSLLNISTHLEKRYPDGKNNYYIRCGGTNKPYNILNKLYNSCDVHLDRKYLKYKTLETVVLGRNTK